MLKYIDLPGSWDQLAPVKQPLTYAFSLQERNLIFNSFWRISWHNKTNFVANNSQKHSFEKKDNEMSRLFVTYSLPKSNMLKNFFKHFVN